VIWPCWLLFRGCFLAEECSWFGCWFCVYSGVFVLLVWVGGWSGMLWWVCCFEGFWARFDFPPMGRLVLAEGVWCWCLLGGRGWVLVFLWWGFVGGGCRAFVLGPFGVLECRWVWGKGWYCILGGFYGVVVSLYPFVPEPRFLQILSPVSSPNSIRFRPRPQEPPKFYPIHPTSQISFPNSYPFHPHSQMSPILSRFHPHLPDSSNSNPVFHPSSQIRPNSIPVSNPRPPRSSQILSRFIPPPRFRPNLSLFIPSHPTISFPNSIPHFIPNPRFRPILPEFIPTPRFVSLPIPFSIPSPDSSNSPVHPVSPRFVQFPYPDSSTTPDSSQFLSRFNPNSQDFVKFPYPVSSQLPDSSNSIPVSIPSPRASNSIPVFHTKFTFFRKVIG